MKRYLKFWGTRGSCPVSGPEYIEFGGNTPCLELRYDEHSLIFDAGTGIRPMGLTLTSNQPISIFLSHTHLDHVIGLPFFDPIYKKDQNITIYSPDHPKKSCKELLSQLFNEEFFPVYLNEMQANLSFQTFHQKKPLKIGDLTLSFHPTCHPGLTHCFKIQTPHQTICYTTDNELIDPDASLIDFYQKADLFIHEAQYDMPEYEKKKGWGHSSLSKVVSLVEKISPKKWLVTHHDPKHTDQTLRSLKKTAQELLKRKQISCPVEWIGDGYTIALK